MSLDYILTYSYLQVYDYYVQTSRNALIMEEGETFADADVGFRHVVIWGGLLATRLNIVIIDLQVRVGKDVVKRHVGSFPYGCKLPTATNNWTCVNIRNVINPDTEIHNRVIS
jgi:hypothetical protein